MVAAGIEELDHAKQFREIDEPIGAAIVVRIVGTATLVRSAGHETILASRLATKALGIEELDHPK
jgi:hypothetical protein